MGQTATTESGRLVLLSDDGTWVYREMSGATGAADFRGSRWGSSLDEVLSAESVPPTVSSSDSLRFNATLSDMSMDVLYFFIDRRLVRAKYFVTETYLNESRYILKRQDLEELLSEKYGKPTEHDQFWHDDLYRDDPSEWGAAVSRGDLSWFVTWETPSTKVVLALSGEDYECHLQIEYSSTALAGLEQAAQRSQALGMI